MPKEEAPKSKISAPAMNRTGQGWLYGALTVVGVALVFMAGLGVANHYNFRQNHMLGFKSSETGLRTRGGFMAMHGGLGDNVTINDQSRISGVVTAVSNSNFTVAGQGATNQITTNSSTDYHGGDQVKVNDTVIVTGTKSGDTVTATNVVINP